MTEKLKPCPFCGETNITVIDVGSHIYDLQRYAVICNSCGGYMAKDFTSTKEAIKSWNRRV